MDRLWSPWRYRYVSEAASQTGCIFCEAGSAAGEDHYVVHRGRLNFVLLNIFPYTTGHLMIAPYAHVARPEQATEETLIEMMLLTREATLHLQQVYRPEGLNIGMNLGKCAGAGVAGHMHMHVLPRWVGDASFMTTVGETRVLPEDLAETRRKLRQAFASPRSGPGS